MTGTGAPEVRTLEDVDRIAQAAAAEFLSSTGEALRNAPTAAVALSGGSTPRKLYALLASDDFRGRVRWPRIHFFFGDERHVGPEDAESNYRMAAETMLSRVPVPPENVHRIRAEDPSAEAAARSYEREIEEHFRLAPGQFPRFDLALLGLGTDGHTASLFPGTKGLSETRRRAVSNWIGKLDTERITLTAPTFNAAAEVVFLVCGDDKSAPLKSVLEGAYEPTQLPAQLIRPGAGRLLWLADRAAASRLRLPAGGTQ
ncbi:MAG TPA: 6-phosphogluconolactonase [Thermoanaerobaculia bacterium]|nr:6-phosphogluconolactonase [Thermoanaerobaculia bacterium]